MTKLLGIVQIRGWNGMMDEHELKTFCLVENKDGIQGNFEFIQPIRRNIANRKLEHEKLKSYQHSMEELEYHKVETHSFRGVYKDYSNADLRASFPTNEVLAGLLELEKW